MKFNINTYLSFKLLDLSDVADAITRDDIRSLITANTITIKSFTGTSHGRAQAKRIQKAKRGTKQGSLNFVKFSPNICANFFADKS